MTGPIVEEVQVNLELNSTPLFSWRCTPADIEAMIVGRLFTTGIITHPDAVHLAVDRVSDELIHATARVDATSHITTRSGPTLAIPSPEIFSDLFRDLFNTVDKRHESGGMHAAAATDGMRIVRQVEDVGRHNTIDKICGLLLLDGASFDQFGLITSSRISGEIAHKAARAGFAWLASRSIPTSLAVRFARDANMPIIGRAAGKGAHVYS